MPIVGLIDVDNILPNLALMKISTYYKQMGIPVEFVQPQKEYELIYASSIFTNSKEKCLSLQKFYGDKLIIGGSGWSLTSRLPREIEICNADYDLYTEDIIYKRIKGIMTRKRRLEKATQIVNAGIGFTSRGCFRSCPFCIVGLKEGPLKQDQNIKDIINPKSNILVLHDNNFTADPYCIDKLEEIKERKLIVDINQGCDVRIISDEIAFALSSVKHLRGVHYAWDLMSHENQVISGIKRLSKYIRPTLHKCFILVGFNTSFEEDVYRFRKLTEIGVDPYVMVYNKLPDVRLRHFARWVNGYFYKKCSFEEYIPWVNAQQIKYEQMKLFT